jgi:ABC-type lipopolysaccharide export system ATPase subunit
VLLAGAVLADGTPRELVENAAVSRHFLGDTFEPFAGAG